MKFSISELIFALVLTAVLFVFIRDCAIDSAKEPTTAPKPRPWSFTDD